MILDSQQPFFSVVMPAYNAEMYICEAIESVLNQSFLNWELVITNDGSSDHTEELVSKYLDDNRIKVFTTEQSGSAKIARDYAILHSIGKYIVFLDSDDYLDKTYLETIFNIANQSQPCVILSKMCFFSTKGIVENIIPEDSLVNKKISGYQALKLTLPSWKIGFNGAAIKRDYWEKVKIFNKSPRLLNADELDSRIYLSRADSVYISNSNYYFRENVCSTTRKFNPRNIERVLTDECLLNYLENCYGSDKDIMKAGSYLSYCNVKSLCLFYFKNLNKINSVDRVRSNDILRGQCKLISSKEYSRYLSYKDLMILSILKILLWMF